MKIYPYKIVLLACFMALCCCSNTALLAQNCAEPSERILQRFLRQINTEKKYQRLKIGGMVKGAFTKKGQVDYVFWLNEQTTEGEEKKRQLIKLVCTGFHWEIASVGWLPQGLVISKENFIDVTGDEVLEFLYNYSYANNNCVDGCAVLSLQGASFQELYSKKEERPCQDVDWATYQTGAELPFISYKLQYKKLKPTEKEFLVEHRFVKKYNGGRYNEEILAQAKVDSTTIILEYDAASNSFLQPIDAPCNAAAFMDGIINNRHPAIRKATAHLNKQQSNQFYIESVYKASLSQKGQTDFLFFSNRFTSDKDWQEKRKIVKAVCNGQEWKIAGILYVNADFSTDNIKDIDGDGIAEILVESQTTTDTTCIKSYRILSFRGAVGKLIYAHKNTYTFCDVYDMNTNSIIDGQPIGLEYSIAFEDVDKDGRIELLRSSSKGVTVFKYDAKQERYLPKR